MVNRIIAKHLYNKPAGVRYAVDFKHPSISITKNNETLTIIFTDTDKVLVDDIEVFESDLAKIINQFMDSV